MNSQVFIFPFLTGTLLLTVFAIFAITITYIYKEKLNKSEIEKQILDKKILSTRIEEQERVMNHISTEVHDNIGQIAHFLLMSNRMLGNMISEKEQLQIVENNYKMLNQLISDVDNISHSLNSDFISNNSLFYILDKELEYLNTTRNIKCKISLTGSSGVLSPNEELIIYRITQEAIHNVLKHSKAQNLCILIAYKKYSFSMAIEDDGIGFDKNKISSKGIGMQNMLERIKCINGTLKITSTLANGCIILLQVDRSPTK